MRVTAVFEAQKIDNVTIAALVVGILVPAYSTSLFLHHQSDKTTAKASLLFAKSPVTSYMASLAASSAPLLLAFEK